MCFWWGKKKKGNGVHVVWTEPKLHETCIGVNGKTLHLECINSKGQERALCCTQIPPRKHCRLRSSTSVLSGNNISPAPSTWSCVVGWCNLFPALHRCWTITRRARGHSANQKARCQRSANQSAALEITMWKPPMRRSPSGGYLGRDASAWKLQ